MLQFYVVDNLWKGTLDIHHFRSLPDAIRSEEHTSELQSP